jgi:hypothetical protein
MSNSPRLPAPLQLAITQHRQQHHARFQRMHAYYTNPITPLHPSAADNTSTPPYRQAQEWGLPARITGIRPARGALFATTAAATIPAGTSRKEVVIENDISWRIQTQLDYLLGDEVQVLSASPQPELAAVLTRLLALIFARFGGQTFFQQLALIGSVFGHVDVLVKLDTSAVAAVRMGDAPTHTPLPGDGPDPSPAPTLDTLTEHRLRQLAGCIILEIIDPLRGIPILHPTDFRQVLQYIVITDLHAATASHTAAAVEDSWWKRWIASRPGVATHHTTTAAVIDVLTADQWQRYENDRLVAQGTHSLGHLPLVHIQNQTVPMSYTGQSDVEPLMPLQDELNTRLSDRAHRLALQSFRMYLGKGIDNFDQLTVGPGRLWLTDNPDAQVQEFGGDASAPSEDAHFADIRAAMDKLSSVSPVAAGVLRQKLGNLTSAAALRLTMQALLAKTHRKRTHYGAGLQQISQLALEWLHTTGLLLTQPDDRATHIRWPAILPEDPSEKLRQAEVKLRLGVKPETVLSELGY